MVGGVPDKGRKDLGSAVGQAAKELPKIKLVNKGILAGEHGRLLSISQHNSVDGCIQSREIVVVCSNEWTLCIA